MVVIFGWGQDAQDHGEVALLVCPNCHNQVYMHDIRSQGKISLYFVPLIPTGSHEYLACPICRHGVAVPPGHQSAVERMRATTNQFKRGGAPLDYYTAAADAFWRSLGVNPSATQPVAGVGPVAGAGPVPPAGPAAAPASSPAVAAEVARLEGLHTAGVLTDSEFAAAKRRVLGG